MVVPASAAKPSADLVANGPRPPVLPPLKRPPVVDGFKKHSLAKKQVGGSDCEAESGDAALPRSLPDPLTSVPRAAPALTPSLLTRPRPELRPPSGCGKAGQAEDTGEGPGGGGRPGDARPATPGIANEASEVGGSGKIVPAIRTPRGSILVLSGPGLADGHADGEGEVREGEARSEVATEVGFRSHTDSIEGLGCGPDNASLRARAECAEEEVRQLRAELRKFVAEVRRLRAEAYRNQQQQQQQQQQTTGSSTQVTSGATVSSTSGTVTSTAEVPVGGCEVSRGDAADALAAQAAAEERATRAEAEVLRLHIELQASRSQIALISEQKTVMLTGLQSTPPMVIRDEELGCTMSSSAPPSKYEVGSCLKFSLGCLCFFFIRFLLFFPNLLFHGVKADREASSTDESGVERSHPKGAGKIGGVVPGRAGEAPVKAFCADMA